MLALALLAFVSSMWGQTTVTLTTLHNLNDGDGAAPDCDLVRSSNGTLYGTCNLHGSNYGGTVFKITPDETLTVIYDFGSSDNNADGVNPVSTLTEGKDGDFYGTTEYGGTNGNYGTIFKITPAGALTTLHRFAGSDGANPFATVIQGTDGNFYGTTSTGGANGYGTVFMLTPGGKLTTLINFNDFDGATPHASLIQGSDGNFYGTTLNGGTNDYGTIFEITPAGESTVLHRFSGGDGQNPPSSLTQGSDGSFYGTTSDEGGNGNGTIFKITAAGAFTTLHTFNSADGSGPGYLLQASDGNFYGTTYDGGANGDGTIYEITPAGVFTSLYSFSGSNGANIYGGLIEGSKGTFYGATGSGGEHNDGTIYELVVSPTITSPTSATATAGQPFSYQNRCHLQSDELRRTGSTSRIVPGRRQWPDFGDTEVVREIHLNDQRLQRRRERFRKPDFDCHGPAGHHQRHDGRGDTGQHLLLSDYGDE